jgi:hypothetical protein
MKTSLVLLTAGLLLFVGCRSATTETFVGAGSRDAMDSLRLGRSIEEWVGTFLESAVGSTRLTRQQVRGMAEAIESRILTLGPERDRWASLRLRVLQLAAEYPKNRKGNARRIREALGQVPRG